MSLIDTVTEGLRLHRWPGTRPSMSSRCAPGEPLRPEQRLLRGLQQSRSSRSTRSSVTSYMTAAQNLAPSVNATPRYRPRCVATEYRLRFHRLLTCFQTVGCPVCDGVSGERSRGGYPAGCGCCGSEFDTGSGHQSRATQRSHFGWFLRRTLRSRQGSLRAETWQAGRRTRPWP